MSDETFVADTEEYECTICKTDMGVKSFDTALPSEDCAELPRDVHRLSCNHAFHSSCLLFSFRINSTVACPLCRSQSPSQVHMIQRGGYNITITEADMEDDDQEDPFVEMNTALRRIRSTSPIRSARSLMKETTRNYNTLRTRLRQFRREIIAQAMVDFRALHREEFRKIQRDYVAACTTVCSLEREALIKERGVQAYSNASWRSMHELMGTGAHIKDEDSGRRAEPWNSSFWYA